MPSTKINVPNFRKKSANLRKAIEKRLSIISKQQSRMEKLNKIIHTATKKDTPRRRAMIARKRIGIKKTRALRDKSLAKLKGLEDRQRNHQSRLVGAQIEPRVKDVFSDGGTKRVIYSILEPLHLNPDTYALIKEQVAKWLVDLTKTTKRKLKKVLQGNHVKKMVLYFNSDEDGFSGSFATTKVDSINEIPEALNGLYHKHGTVEINGGQKSIYDWYFYECEFILSKASDEGECEYDNRAKKPRLYMNDRLGYFKCHPLKSRDKNCGIQVIIFLAKYTKKRAKGIRKELKLPKGALKPKHLDKVAKFVGLASFIVINVMGTPIHTYGEINEDTPIICLMSNHYYWAEWITENKCPKCGETYQKEHSVTRCKGKQTYQNGVLAPEKERKEAVIGKKLKKLSDKEKWFIWFDGEMFVKPFRKNARTISVTGKDGKQYKQKEGKFVPYAWGWYSSREKKYRKSYGESATKEFMDWMLKQKPDKILFKKGKKKGQVRRTIKPTYIAYNGAKFDFHFIHRELIRRGIKIDKLILANGRILSLEWRNGRVWDLCQFTQCSLARACENYGLKKNDSKGDFEHLKITKGFESAEKYKSEILPYLKKDVMSLRKVHLEFAKGFETMSYKQKVKVVKDDKIVEKEELMNFGTTPSLYMTLSSAAYTIWANKLGSLIIEVPDAEKMKFISRAVYGGRTTPFQKNFESKWAPIIDKEWAKVKPIFEKEYKPTIDNKDTKKKLQKDNRFKRIRGISKKMLGSKDFIANIDVNSEYPASMASVKKNKNGSGFEVPIEYPIGYSKWSETPQQIWKKKLPGIYEVDWEAPKELFIPVLPSRQNNDGVDWDLGKGTGFYCTADLETAEHYGYTFTFKNKCLYWEETSADVFTHYIGLMYDKKKEAKIAGNSVNYQIYKLLMNSLFGKTLQAPKNNKTAVIKTTKQLLEFYREHTQISINEIGNEGRAVLVTGKKIDEESVSKKPRHLGVWILAFSRRIWLKYCEAIDPTLSSMICSYVDTDCLHVTGEGYETLKYKGFLHETKLGYGGNDCPDDAMIFRETNLAPKQYAYQYLSPYGYVGDVMKCKGIMKDKLKKEWYQDGQKHEVEWMGFKKHTTLTSKDRENGIELFDVSLKYYSRTFNPEWKKGNLVDNLFIPKGYNGSRYSNTSETTATSNKFPTEESV